MHATAHLNAQKEASFSWKPADVAWLAAVGCLHADESLTAAS